MQDKITNYIRAGFAGLYLLTHEEVRAEAELKQLEAKGKETRAETRRKRLGEIDRKLEILYSEWTVLGEKKKKW